MERVKQERKKTQEKLRRLGTAFVDGVYAENDYKRQKRLLELELESLVVPQADAAEEAGKLIERLPKLWKSADLADRRRVLMSMLEAVYVECKEEKRVVGIKPKPAFRPVFQVAATRAGSDVVLIREEDPDKPNQPPPHGHQAEGIPCSWWRRGRVELPVQKTLMSRCTTGLASN